MRILFGIVNTVLLLSGVRYLYIVSPILGLFAGIWIVGILIAYVKQH